MCIRDRDGDDQKHEDRPVGKEGIAPFDDAQKTYQEIGDDTVDVDEGVTVPEHARPLILVREEAHDQRRPNGGLHTQADAHDKA